MIKVIIFDLDNTLYNEYDYVISGFKAVASFLDKEESIDYCAAYSLLLESFVLNGRGNNFDYLCQKLNIDSDITNKLVDVYRKHCPEIILREDIITFLIDLAKKYTLCLLTNGWVVPQKRKVAALKINEYFDSIIYSQQDGLDFAKPHPKYFEHILELYDIEPEEALMIGDDPIADIQGAQNVGMPCFQVTNKLDDEEKKYISQLLQEYSQSNI
nr:HAD family hydrolase [uncultured Methanolobus sp.]